MHIHPIRTKEDHSAALERYTELKNAVAGTPEGDERDVLAVLIDRYDNQQYSDYVLMACVLVGFACLLGILAFFGSRFV